MLKATILKKAVWIAKNLGFSALTRRAIARASACAVGTVNYHFETMDALRNEIVDYAVENEIVEIIIQAHAIRHPRVRNLSPALKERIAAHIAGR